MKTTDQHSDCLKLLLILAASILVCVLEHYVVHIGIMNSEPSIITNEIIMSDLYTKILFYIYYIVSSETIIYVENNDLTD